MGDPSAIVYYYSYIRFREDPWRLTPGRQMVFYLSNAIWMYLLAHLSFYIFEQTQPILVFRPRQPFSRSPMYLIAQCVVGADFPVALAHSALTLSFLSPGVREMKKLRHPYACLSSVQRLVFPIVYTACG